MPDVTKSPLAELLREMWSQPTSGVIRLQREPLRAVVYVENGKPVFAASNLKELRFTDYLLKRGIVTQEHLAALARVPDAALGDELMRRKLVDGKTVEQISTALVTDILRVLLLWTDGTWEFDERSRLAESFRAAIDVPSLLLAAARRLNSDFVVTRFSNAAEIIKPTTKAKPDHELLPSEGFLLSRLDQPMPLDNLVSLSGQSEPAAKQIIYGLALSGFLERSEWPVVMQSSQRQKPQPTPAPVAAAVTPSTPDTQQVELEAFLVRVEAAKNHYDVLDTTTAAAAAEIKRAYYDFARRFHPDRFHANNEVHRRVEMAFAKITQAYEALTDATQRSAYDAKLAAQQRVRTADVFPPPPPPKTDSGRPPGEQAAAEIRFREGYAALQSGQIKQAIPDLAAAAHSAPDEPRYRAYYGKALAASGTAQRMAETELQTAIKLDPRNASYHLMLAQLYYGLNFFKRARTEVMRALELDPKHAEAQALLGKMNDK